MASSRRQGYTTLALSQHRLTLVHLSREAPAPLARPSSCLLLAANNARIWSVFLVAAAMLLLGSHGSRMIKRELCTTQHAAGAKVTRQREFLAIPYRCAIRA